MTKKYICPRDCPGRRPGCGATCEKFQKHRAECAERYKKNAQEQAVKDVAYSMRHMKRK
jgi:hypothetical protein